jgi:hypothetical protein
MLAAQNAEAIGGNPLDYKKVSSPDLPQQHHLQYQQPAHAYNSTVILCAAHASGIAVADSSTIVVCGQRLLGNCCWLVALHLQELARKRRKIPLEDYSDGPQGLKIYGEQQPREMWHMALW